MNTTLALIERWFWLGISLVIALFVVAARWIMDRPGSRFAGQVNDWQSTPGIMGLIHTGRLLYAVGLPALVLFWRGALSERLLGLKPVHWWVGAGQVTTSNWSSWVMDFGWGMVCFLLISGVMAIGQAGQPRQTRRDPWVALREAIYHQVHWAFYREPFVLLWGISPGAWLGLLPVAGEALLNPERWRDYHDPAALRDLILRMGLACASVLLYLKTQNLWIAILMDAAIGWSVGYAATLPRAAK